MNDSVREATDRLRAAGNESARADARHLWEHARGNDAEFRDLIERRLRHEPVAYIAGHKEFWSLDFEVGPGVLVPRPETETLIEAALTELPDRNSVTGILDLGVGSGCVLVSLLSEYPNSRGLGIDSSEAALGWARRNVLKRGMMDRTQLRVGSWEDVEGTFDLIVSNPPYIPTSEISALPRDIRDHEPKAALDGGPDGVDAYRSIASVLTRALRPGAMAFLEIGAGQHQLVSEIMTAAGLKVVRLALDLAGIRRCVVLRVP